MQTFLVWILKSNYLKVNTEIFRLYGISIKKIINDLKRAWILSIRLLGNGMLCIKPKRKWDSNVKYNRIYSTETRCKMQYFLLYLCCSVHRSFISHVVCFELVFSAAWIAHPVSRIVYILGFRGRLKSTFALFMSFYFPQTLNHQLISYAVILCILS